MSRISFDFFYEGRIDGNDYSYDHKAYGLWGIQPGIEETFLYNGIDIREYSNNLEKILNKMYNEIFAQLCYNVIAVKLV